MLSLVGAICLSLLAAVGDSMVLTAKLDYGTFRGAYDPTYNITYWQKIPYAAPPIGRNRFRAPQPPLPITTGVYDSTQPFDMCPQRTVNGSEDCLYLGLYGRPWAAGAPLRPVVVTFHGGGFIQGSASFAVPPSAYPILNVSAAVVDVVFVYPNYRLNAFGFLPGREVARDGESDANAGLLDQAAALRWAQRHARHFGGDPARVTVWGQSAGGGSVIAQTIADHGAAEENWNGNGNGDGDGDGNGKGKGKGEERGRLPFTRALASSPFWPKTYRVDSPEAQARYDALAALTGCGGGGGGGGPGSLACLKRVDAQRIRNASLAVVDAHKYDTATFGWGPVIDGTFLRAPLSSASSAARGGLATAYAMYNTHEGESFAPPGLKNEIDSGAPPFNASAASFSRWLEGFLPGLVRTDLRRLEALYPATGGDGKDGSGGSQFERAGLIYRDATLACPGLWMAGSARDGGWIGEYTIAPALHASDVYWWNTVNAAQKADPLHYKGYAGALASFFMTGDPNTLKLTADDVPGLPELKTRRQWIVDGAGFATAELTPLRERCAFWRDVASDVPI
ncbi:carboxylesterase [Xylaria palmicola]|nr:carboxylesterase [Xylaria palmicola]